MSGFARIRALLALGLAATRPVLSATADSMSPELLSYASFEGLTEDIYHPYMPGHAFLTSSSLELDWNVSNTAPASVLNLVMLPMDISSSGGGVYYTLDSITVSGYLDLAPGATAKGINVDFASDLPGGSVAGSAMHTLTTATLVPTEGSSGEGYTGAFTVTVPASADSDVAAAEKQQLCSGLMDWEYQLGVTIDLLPGHSDDVVGMVGSNPPDAPLLISFNAVWHDC